MLDSNTGERVSLKPNEIFTRGRYDIADMSKFNVASHSDRPSFWPWRPPASLPDVKPPGSDDAPFWQWGPMTWAVIAAFGTYFCMYAFRKPFSVSQYPDLDAWGLHYKTVAVAAQVFGYMLSKFIGIKVLTEMAPSRARPV